MKNEALYRRLADAGSEAAKAILDSEEEGAMEGDGAVPAEESSEAESDDTETSNLEELAEFAEKLGALKVKADILTQAGDHKGAGDAHMERGDNYYWKDQHRDAMDAYRMAARSYKQHGEDACNRLTPEQIAAWHAGEAPSQ